MVLQCSIYIFGDHKRPLNTIIFIVDVDSNDMVIEDFCNVIGGWVRK